MMGHRRTLLTLAVTAALSGLLASTADAGSPILSGYGGPGAGEQMILGSQLLNDHSGGGPAGPAAGTVAAQSEAGATYDAQSSSAPTRASGAAGDGSATASGSRQ